MLIEILQQEVPTEHILATQIEAITATTKAQQLVAPILLREAQIAIPEAPTHHLVLLVAVVEVTQVVLAVQVAEVLREVVDLQAEVVVGPAEAVEVDVKSKHQTLN